MTRQAVSVSGLLALLGAVGARLALEGDGLALSGKRPPTALLEAVKARRAEVLAYLRDEDAAKAEAADSPTALPSPDFSEVEKTGGEVVASGHNMPPPWEALPRLSESDTESETVSDLETASKSNNLLFLDTRPAPRPLPDWEAISAQPGHCGSCARATDAPDWGALMVTCSAPPSAFEAGIKPLALHVGHRCAAYLEDGEETGRGYRSRLTGQTGQRHSPRQGARP